MYPPNNKGKRIVKVNALTQAQLIKLLLDGLYTCEELADLTGLHYVTALQYTRELHRAGAAHICAWEKDTRGRDAIRVYKLGAGKDAKRTKKTSAERARAYQAKKRMLNAIQASAGIYGGLAA